MGHQPSGSREWCRLQRHEPQQSVGTRSSQARHTLVGCDAIRYGVCPWNVDSEVCSSEWWVVSGEVGEGLEFALPAARHQLH